MTPASLIYLINQQQIHCQNFKNKHRLNPRYFTRNRELPFITIVSLILQKNTRSRAIEANHLGLVMNKEPVSKQATSADRHKIGISAF